MQWLMKAGALARRVGQYLWQSRLMLVALLIFWWLLIATIGAHGQVPAYWWLAFMVGVLFLGMAQGFAISDVQRAFRSGYAKGYLAGREATAFLRQEVTTEQVLLDLGIKRPRRDDDADDDEKWRHYPRALPPDTE